MSEIIWEANPEYVFEGSGVICNVSGRDYKKVNEGKCLVCVYYSSDGYTGPVLVSTDPDAVTFAAYYGGWVTFTWKTTVEYLGAIWYVSNPAYFMAGNQTPTGFAKKLDNNKHTLEEAVQLLFAVSEVKVLETCKYLIQDATTIYTVADSVLEDLQTTDLTAGLFQTHGMEDPPTSDILLTLNNPKVLAWSDEEQPELTATITTTPYPQTIYSPEYDMTDPTILGIEKVIVEASDDVTFAISFDGGETWKYYTGTEWATLSEETSGMSTETIMAVPTDKWTEVATTGTFKVRATLPSVESTLSSFIVDYLNA